MSAPYVDKEFPPDARSLGPALPRNLQWRRAHEAVAVPGELADVFTGCIEPSDIRQGTLGDCWLMSAIAAVAEFEDVVRETFVTEEFNDECKYTVKLFEPYTLEKGAKPPPMKTGEAKKNIEGKWLYITVDDFIPCLKDGSPACAKGVEGEFWVCLLEKAFAKYVGSYSALSGGYPTLALMALTGKPAYQYMFGRALGAPAAYELDFCSAHCRQVAQQPGMARVRKTGVKYDKEEFWSYLLECDRSDYVMVLATGGKDELTETGAERGGGGVVDGHAYSLNTVVDCARFRLCQVRNPWGDFEWRGDFSDASRMWLKYPEVAAACKFDPHHVDEHDGTFWILYDDLLSTFESVTVNFLVRSDKKRAPSELFKRTKAKLGLATLKRDAPQLSPNQSPSTSPDQGSVPTPFHMITNHMPRPAVNKPVTPTAATDTEGDVVNLWPPPTVHETHPRSQHNTTKFDTTARVVNPSSHTSIHVAQHSTTSSSTTVAGGELQRRLQRRTEAAVQLLGKDPYAALASRREVLRRAMEPDVKSAKQKLLMAPTDYKVKAAELESLDGLSVEQLTDRFERTTAAINVTLQQLAGAVDRRVSAEGMLTPLSKALVKEWDALGTLDEGDTTLLPLQNLLAEEEAAVEAARMDCDDLERRLTEAGVSLHAQQDTDAEKPTERGSLRWQLERISMPLVDAMSAEEAQVQLGEANLTIASLTDALYAAHDVAARLNTSSSLVSRQLLHPSAAAGVKLTQEVGAGQGMYHVRPGHSVYDNTLGRLGFF